MLIGRNIPFQHGIASIIKGDKAYRPDKLTGRAPFYNMADME
jgi:hypothetical protein